MARARRWRRRSRRPDGKKARLEADFSKRKFGGAARAELKNPKNPQNPKNTPKSPKTIPEGSRPKVRISKRKRAGGSLSLGGVVGARRRPLKISKRRRFWRSQPPEAKIRSRRVRPKVRKLLTNRLGGVDTPESTEGARHRIDGIDRKRPKSTPIDQNWTGTH